MLIFGFSASLSFGAAQAQTPQTTDSNRKNWDALSYDGSDKQNISVHSFVVIDKTFRRNGRITETKWKIEYSKSCHAYVALVAIDDHKRKSMSFNKGRCKEFDGFSDNQMESLVNVGLDLVKSEGDFKLSRITFNASLSESFKADIMSVLIEASKSTPHEKILWGEWAGETLTNGFSSAFNTNHLISRICKLSIGSGYECMDAGAGVNGVTFNSDYRTHSDFTSEFENSFKYPVRVFIQYEKY